jgi:xylulokinase
MSQVELVLGLDLGTTFFKVGLFARDGTLRGLGRVPTNPQRTPDGRCELPVPQFWSSLRTALAEALREADCGPAAIVALSYSSQANSFVLLDANNRPLTSLVLWPDRRGSAEHLERFSASAEFAAHTGFFYLGAEFAAMKWQWFQKNAPALWEKCARVATLPDYLVLALTGEFACDTGTAALTGALDVRQGQWWEPALAAYGVSNAQLARPAPSGTIIGKTLRAATELLGLPAGLPCALGTLDHHAAALGSGIGKRAEISISTGTVLAALRVTREFQPRPDCYFAAHVSPGCYFQLTFDPTGAGQLDAYRSLHAPELSIEQLLAQAKESVVHKLETPHGTSVAALLERICAAQGALVRRLAAHHPVRSVIATGGGSRSPFWLQLQANALGVPVLTPSTEERACLGAALFAARAAGWHASLPEAIEAMVSPGPVYEPA